MVVRPYGERIRARVFSLVDAAGYQISADDLVPQGESDADAAARVFVRGSRRLVVPYHGHRDREGVPLDGLTFVEHLRKLDPSFPWRVLMPVSRFGAAAVESVRESLDATLLASVLFVSEDDLEQPRLVSALRQHFASAENHP